MSTASPSGSIVRLLDHDPELARHFGANEVARATSDITVAAHRVRPGHLPLTPHRPRGMIGFLILEGTIVRDVPLAGRSCSQLLGPGDVIDPWMDGDGLSGGAERRHRVATQALMAVLDDRFAAHAVRWPQLLPAVMERMLQQAEQLSVLYALARLPRVEVRILAFLWHLAQRWGRVGPDGVIVPVELTHRELGDLVGGRRPTISIGMRDLHGDGLLRRRPEGGFWLARESWKLLAGTPCPVDPAFAAEPAGAEAATAS